MAPSREKGAGNLEGIFIIIFLIFIMLVTPRSTGPNRGLFSSPTVTGVSSASNFSSGTSLRGSIEGQTVSSSYRTVAVGQGNASYEYQPYKEYITVENWGDKPVNITGWTLKNGKDRRTYDLQGQLQRFSADVARIPQAAPLLLPSGGSPLQDVVLARGERAVITTGTVGVTSPYRITSFKENACTGYLEYHPDYAFDPPLQISCPQPSREPGIEGLETSCRLFIETLSSCTTPVFDAKDDKGDSCETCIRGERLSSSCAAFIKEHFSYRGCVAYHAGDPGFSSGRTWRVFLGRGWEMWAENYETIELFDAQGLLAAFQNYR